MGNATWQNYEAQIVTQCAESYFTVTDGERKAYSKEFFGVHNFSGSSPPLPLGVGALGVGPLESS